MTNQEQYENICEKAKKYEETLKELVKTQDELIAILGAWKKTQEELMAYAEEIASTYFYDSRVEATLHCLTVMRKNWEVAKNDKNINNNL